jgi:hypothetical protein
MARGDEGRIKLDGGRGVERTGKTEEETTTGNF